MTPALAISLIVAVLACAYVGIWAEARWSGDRRRAGAARDGLAVHLAFSAAFFVVMGIAP